jgi:predicted DNA-binding transcriptional regulator YafY
MLHLIITLIKALWQSSKLDITYRKIDGTSSQRIIRPYGIAVKNNEWYLVAYCESSNALRTFKCERITGSCMLSVTFLIPESFSLKDYFKKSILNFHSDRTSHEQYPVTVRISKGNARLLKNHEVYSVLETDDILEAKINMYSYECAMQDFWTIFCNSSAVVSPDMVREAVKARLKLLLEGCM